MKATIGLGGAFVEDGEYVTDSTSEALRCALAHDTESLRPLRSLCLFLSLCKVQVATWQGAGNISFEGDAELLYMEDSCSWSYRSWSTMLVKTVHGCL